VHRAPWPTEDELAAAADGDPGVYEVAAAVLTEVRKAKALAKASLRVPATRVVVLDTRERLDRLAAAERDVREAGNVGALETAVAEAFRVETVLEHTA
jgi:valyl-tRNA synthetase